MRERFKNTRLLTNADMGPAEVRRYCALDGAGQRLMQAAMREPQLSARGYHCVLKPALSALAGMMCLCWVQTLPGLVIHGITFALDAEGKLQIVPCS